MSWPMADGNTLLIALVFAAAGFVKGVIGLGLPTVAMGLLAIVLPPVEAAAILVLPSFLTNIWQTVAGPALAALLRRLWPMLLGVCVGTWGAADLMTAMPLGLGMALLGIALALYALAGIAAWRWSVRPRQERPLAPVIGGLTGVITAATGVFVIPAVPFLQAIGLEKDELVQALGLSFTVSTLALAVNLLTASALSASLAGPAILASLAAVAGMAAGQGLRKRLSPERFRRWFFFGLLLLAAYLLARAGLTPSGSPGH